MIFYISAFTRNTLILLFEVMCLPGISSTSIFIDYSAQFLEFVLFVLVIWLWLFVFTAVFSFGSHPWFSFCTWKFYQKVS